MRSRPEIKVRGSGIVFSAGIAGIDANLVIYEAGNDVAGIGYYGAIAEKKDLTKPQREKIAKAIIALWEKFAQ